MSCTLFLLLMVLLPVAHSDNNLPGSCNNHILNVGSVDIYDIDEDTTGKCSPNRECLILSLYYPSDQSWNQACVDDPEWMYINWCAYRQVSGKPIQGKFVCYQDINCKQQMPACPDVPAECLTTDEGDGYCGHTGNSTKKTTSAGTTASHSTSTFTPHVDTTPSPTSLSFPSTTSTSEEVTSTSITASTTTGSTDDDEASHCGCKQGPCPRGECFFAGHCYFFLDILPEAGTVTTYDLPTDLCQIRFSSALAVAVQSADENDFVKRLINCKGLGYAGQRSPLTVFTSGIREEERANWLGWSLPINETLLNPRNFTNETSAVYILKASFGNTVWKYDMFPPKDSSASMVLCEKPVCENGTCRGVDQFGNIWKGCSGKLVEKDCGNDSVGSAFWQCGDDNLFVKSGPDFSECRPDWISDVENEVVIYQYFSIMWKECILVVLSAEMLSLGLSTIYLKVEDFHPFGKFKSAIPEFHFLVRLAETRTTLKEIPEYIKWRIGDENFQAWAWCYNNVTLPSIKVIDLRDGDIEVSLTDPNCEVPKNVCSLNKLQSLSNTLGDIPDSENVTRGTYVSKIFYSGYLCTTDHGYYFESYVRGRNRLLNRTDTSLRWFDSKDCNKCIKPLETNDPFCYAKYQEEIYAASEGDLVSCKAEKGWSFVKNCMAWKASYRPCQFLEFWRRCKKCENHKGCYKVVGNEFKDPSCNVIEPVAFDTLCPHYNTWQCRKGTFVLVDSPDTTAPTISGGSSNSTTSPSSPTPAPTSTSTSTATATSTSTSTTTFTSTSTSSPASSGSTSTVSTAIPFTSTTTTSASTSGAYGCNCRSDWYGLPNGLCYTSCPNGIPGKVLWLCGENSEFVGSPDFSGCVPAWIRPVEDMINKKEDPVTIMDLIKNHTKEGTEEGMDAILDVVKKCADLLQDKYQGLDGGEEEHFTKFTYSYAGVLKDVATNMSVWSNFLEENRLKYTKQIVQVSETVAFSLLNDSTPTSNFTRIFPDDGSSGLAYWISYRDDPSFLSTFEESETNANCSVQVTAIGSTGSTFAAMGLALHHEIGSQLFPPGNATEKKVINTPVLSFSVAAQQNGIVEKITNVTVLLKFKHANQTREPDTIIIHRKLHDGETPSPVFRSSQCYFREDNDWNTSGCYVSYVDKGETHCTCDHLSTLSVLMNVHEYEEDIILETVSLVCSSLSIIGLILTLYVFCFFECLRSERTIIGRHLCACLLVGHIMVMTVLDKSYMNMSDLICSLIACILHYIFMAAFVWMSIEGHHLYRLVIVVFQTDTNYQNLYTLCGYGLPIVVVGLTAAVGFFQNDQPYGRDEVCWLQTNGYVWAFIGPVVFLTSLNLVIMVIAMRLAVVAQVGVGKFTFTHVRLWLKGWFSLASLLGVTWILGLAYIDYNRVFEYCFVVLNGLQGLFIFLFRCVYNEQVRAAVAKKYRIGLSQNEDSRTNQKSRMGNDATKTGTAIIPSEQGTGKSSSESGIYSGVESNANVFVRVDCTIGLGRFDEVKEGNSKRRNSENSDADSKERCDRGAMACGEILEKIKSQRRKSSQEFSAKCADNIKQRNKSKKKTKEDDGVTSDTSLSSETSNPPPPYSETVPLPSYKGSFLVPDGDPFFPSVRSQDFSSDRVTWPDSRAFPTYDLRQRPTSCPTIEEETESVHSFKVSKKKKP